MGNRFGSDLMVESLLALEIPYVSLNPGASFRGLHDSLVHQGAPEMIMTLAENVAVSVAHGYAKATGEPMAAVLHNAVGLQNGAMAVFNAWIDMVPMLVLGGSGPADHAQRRPWIDWIHTAKPQGAITRDITKWDDEPRSLEAVPSSLARALGLASAAPQGPTYVALDALLQEAPAPDDLGPFPPSQPVGRLAAPRQDVEELAARLIAAQRPVIVADFAGRSRAAFDALVELSELLAAPVIDYGARHNFPSTHWADATLDPTRYLRQADAVLAVDVRDLQWATSVSDMVAHTFEDLLPASATRLSIGMNDLLHSGMFDREPLVERAVNIVADSTYVLPVLCDLVRADVGDRRNRAQKLREEGCARREETGQEVAAVGHRMVETTVARATFEAVRNGPWLLAHGGLRGAVRKTWDLEQYGCFLGSSGGEGLGYGVGASLGAALAHRHDDTLVVNLQTDGDLLYSASGLWTAARHDLPVLTVVVNNRSYGRDRTHQSLVGAERGRPPENATVGIDIDRPDIDFGKLAEAQGVESFGKVKVADQLAPTLQRAAATVRKERRPVVVEAVIERRTGHQPAGDRR